MDWKKHQQENIDRFLLGKDKWNEWAQELLREKAELEKAGKWKVRDKWDTDLGFVRTISEISETQDWLDRASIDFSTLHFQVEQNADVEVQGGDVTSSVTTTPVKLISVPSDNINFTNFIFPDNTRFNGTIFTGPASFAEAKFMGVAWFKEAKFIGDASFYFVKFTGQTTFDLAKFTGRASFDVAKFFGDASFYEVMFIGPASFSFSIFTDRVTFNYTKFTGTASFVGAKFTGAARFNVVEFTGAAWFKVVKFTGDARFKQADFKSLTSFEETCFQSHSDFDAIHVERVFSLADAKFTTQVPSFNQAHFKEAPRLDNIKIFPHPKVSPPFKWMRYFWKKKLLQAKARFVRKLFQRISYPFSKFFNSNGDVHDEARYRALKRLAIQAHDHENEQKFFAGEMRSRRGLRDFAIPWKAGIACSVRYWSGVFYDLTSDFGRSLWRPLVLWSIVFCLFSQLYLCQATALSKGECTNTDNMTPSYAAKTIAAKNSLLFLGMDRTGKLKRAYACLYGVSDLYKIPATKADTPRLKNGYKNIQSTSSNMAPNVPAKVSALGILHSILSLSLIFLFFLALRNQFKIK